MITLITDIFGPISFDAVLEEVVSKTATKTSSPLETGAPVNDHVFLNPITYLLTGGVTNTPFLTPEEQIFNLDNFFAGGTATTRKQSAWDTLSTLFNTSSLITVQADLETLENMIIVDLSAPTDKLTKNALIFNATIEEVFIVDTAEGILTAEQLRDIQTKKRGTSNSDKGKFTKEPIIRAGIITKVIDLATR